jgi:broad specificity phosphatase PhoE
MGRVYLVRHTEVSRHWSGRCYGQSDVGLSRAGRIAARELAPSLAALQPARIFVSPLRRARYLAGLLVRYATPVPITIDPRLAECYFGAWEGQSWDAIYRATGNAMMGMIEAPETFRPGGTGETTFEVRARVMAWLGELGSQTSDERAVIAICHGGPIAAIRGTLEGRRVADWLALVPSPGGIISVDFPPSNLPPAAP